MSSSPPINWLRVALTSLLVTLVPVARAAAAPPPPAGPHPRIALGAPVLAALKAQASRPDSSARAAIDACRKAAPAAGEPSGYQGDAWAFPASACGLAYQITGEATYAARGLALLRALLEDVERFGDKKACTAGAPPERAVASIRRDSGYAIRFIGLHAALAYDWLHDAPGMTPAFRDQAGGCFRGWLDWYAAEGYLRTQPGANYHAGYIVAKTLIAIAISGEGGADARAGRYWREVVDENFAQQIVANGLAGDAGGVPQGDHHGVLVGGDWAEGWQYGPLSVIEYALATRALEEQGVSFPALRTWADDLTLRFMHSLTPPGDQSYIGGDVENESATTGANPGPPLATLIGPSGARAAGWAAYLRRRPGAAGSAGLARYGVPVFDALADARVVTPIDPYAASPPRWFLARGTRNLYARSDWSLHAFWSVLTSSPRQVDDHQHVDASSFVFSRAGDPLIVDPSPYGSRSSLTGNAVTLDSDVVGPYYRPSQTPWSSADLPWARATRSGVVAARSDFAGAFAFAEKPSDVTLARRDWVFLPEGEIATVDRALTASGAHLVRLRFRTPATLALAGTLARGTTGGSALAIHAVATSSPATAPRINAIPAGNDCGDGHTFGACTVARFPVGEYALELPGPAVFAVHVIDGLGKGEAPADVVSVNDPVIDGTPPHNREIIGASIRRGTGRTFVVAAASVRRAGDRAPMSYLVPSSGPTRHVAFDAPEDDQGRASVTTAAGADGRCRVTISAGGAGATSGSTSPSMEGRPVIFTVGPSATGCQVAEDPAALMDGDHTIKTNGGAPAVPRVRPHAGRRGVWEHRLHRVPHKKALLAASALFACAVVCVGVVRARRPPRAGR